MRYMKTILQTKSMKLHLIDFKMYSLYNKKKKKLISDLVHTTGFHCWLYPCTGYHKAHSCFFETAVTVSSTVSVSLLLTCVSIKYHLNILHTSHDSNPTSYTSCCLCMLLFFHFEIHWCCLVNPFL